MPTDSTAKQVPSTSKVPTSSHDPKIPFVLLPMTMLWKHETMPMPGSQTFGSVKVRHVIRSPACGSDPMAFVRMLMRCLLVFREFRKREIIKQYLRHPVKSADPEVVISAKRKRLPPGGTRSKLSRLISFSSCGDHECLQRNSITIHPVPAETCESGAKWQTDRCVRYLHPYSATLLVSVCPHSLLLVQLAIKRRIQSSSGYDLIGLERRV